MKESGRCRQSLLIPRRDVQLHGVVIDIEEGPDVFPGTSIRSLIIDVQLAKVGTYRDIERDNGGIICRDASIRAY